MYTVYVLRDKLGHLYKGVTNNIIRRLKEHRSGHTMTTSKMEDVSVVYNETFNNFIDARKREVYLKTAAGRRFLEKQLNKPR